MALLGSRATVLVNQSPAVQRALRSSRFLSAKRLYATATQQGATAKPTWDIRMLYDGECALCMKEVNFLRKRDEGKNKIVFVDIALPDYNPAENAGITFEQAMERIHGILPDGRIVKDVEVFRLLYEAVGLGWVYAITKNETVLKLANAVYAVWAKYRTQITGREALGVILERRRLGAKTCSDTDVSCDVPLKQQHAQKV